LITYRSAKELWLKETLSEGLQDIDEDTLRDLSETISDIAERAEECEGREPQRSLLQAEKERMEGFLRQIVEARASKVLNLAVRQKKSRQITDPEKELLQRASSHIEAYEERFYRIPGEVEGETAPAEGTEEPFEEDAEPEADAVEAVTADVSGSSSIPAAQRNKMVRIRRGFPQFVGPDLNSYGPFRDEDVVSVPDEVSEILISREIGEQILNGEDS